jgi:hypothetical protein
VGLTSVAVAGPDLDDEFGKDEFVDEFGGDEPSEPWHNSIGAVVGASAAGLAVIGILIASVMYMTGQDGPDTPADFVDPSFSATASNTSATTTTATITSTAKVSTTEINAPLTPTTSGSSGTSSGTSTAPSSDGSSSPAFTPRPRQRENDENPGGPTSRRPRFNITRTLPPQQAG